MKSVKKSSVYVALPYAFASSFVVCLVIAICNLTAQEKCVTEGDNNKPAASDFNSTGTYCIVRMKKKKSWKWQKVFPLWTTEKAIQSFLMISTWKCANHSEVIMKKDHSQF